jgi:hypothetical protein
MKGYSMRLVYKDSGKEVKTGDVVHINNVPHYVQFFSKPHKPSSSGHVVVREMSDTRLGAEYYVGVIGAEWIEREDQIDWSDGPMPTAIRESM